MTLGEKIKELRKKHNVTQMQLAKHCKVSRQTIYNWENNLRTPNADNLSLLGSFFGLNILSFMDNSDDIKMRSVFLLELENKNIEENKKIILSHLDKFNSVGIDHIVNYLELLLGVEEFTSMIMVETWEELGKLHNSENEDVTIEHADDSENE